MPLATRQTATGVASTCIFYDVTQGDIDVNCTGQAQLLLGFGTRGRAFHVKQFLQSAYGATTGWDFATGIGSVNAANLVNNWPSAPPGPTLVSATAVSATEIDLIWTNPSGL